VEALRRESETLTAQRAEFVNVADAFAVEGIRAALIKSVGLAPSFPYRSDNVDTLVPLEQGEAAAKVLSRLGYVELRNIEEPRKFLFKRFSGARVASAIHLHEQVGWGTGFLNEGWLWERASRAFDDRLVVHPGPEDGMLITLAHAFYEDKEVKAWDLVKVRHRVSLSGFGLGLCGAPSRDPRLAFRFGRRAGLLARVERTLFAAPCIPESIPGYQVRAHRFENGYAAELQEAPRGSRRRFHFRTASAITMPRWQLIGR